MSAVLTCLQIRQGRRAGVEAAGDQRGAVFAFK